MIIYDDAQETDLIEIANLHKLCFPKYFISSLGARLINAYYYEFLKEEAPFIVAKDGNKIIGFCMGYYRNTTARNEFIKNNKIPLILRLSMLCLSLNPVAIKKCLQYIKDIFKNDNLKKKSVEADVGLLSICVSKEYRGTSISAELVKKFEKNIQDKGAMTYVLSVYSTNYRAISFYEKNGMRIVDKNASEYKFYKSIDIG